ncbi:MULTISPECIES: hypothetical protein [Paracoccus]|uniref:hypothetical protein n=1 Tax=Paracoccus TaxID=265 RepID=UPI001FB72027|nr:MULTISPECIES: hypothetical protein [Paracoccus]MCJ1901235.1 hypothetical protein [Paracoccus versutus]MDF3905871.1 hypothetical protein [Paracoccus sp. AS002]
MRTERYSIGPTTEAGDGLCVVDDFPAEIPVTDAELDVIEAFLGAQLRALVDGAREEGANTGLNTCHNHAKLKRPAKSRISRK